MVGVELTQRFDRRRRMCHCDQFGLLVPAQIGKECRHFRAAELSQLRCGTTRLQATPLVPAAVVGADCQAVVVSVNRGTNACN
jgi:hypothetical protein